MKVNCKLVDETWQFSDDKRILYTCKVKEASIKEPGTEITAFIGEHLPDRSNSDVVAISFNCTVVEFFPRGLQKLFPNLKALQIRSCGLKKISQEDVIGLENLEDFCLKNNELRSLPSDLFIGFQKLQEISFKSNKLEFLSSKLFEPIAANGLQYVSFTNNKKINSFFELGKKKSVASLQKLMMVIDEKCHKPTEDKEKEKFDREFAARFKELWTSKNYSDLTIVSGSEDENGKPKEFAVHKNVLGTQSSVFAAVFKNEIKEKREEKMKIENFSTETIEEMLKFIYTGQLKESNAMDLFAIAGKYDVKLLKETTEKIILRNINDSNAIEVFSLAHLHNSDEMKRAAFRTIKEMFPETPLSDDLMENLENLEEIVTALRDRKRRILDAEKDFQAKMQKFA